jgi:hypothetical protein
MSLSLSVRELTVRERMDFITSIALPMRRPLSSQQTPERTFKKFRVQTSVCPVFAGSKLKLEL